MILFSLSDLYSLLPLTDSAFPPFFNLFKSVGALRAVHYFDGLF